MSTRKVTRRKKEVRVSVQGEQRVVDLDDTIPIDADDATRLAHHQRMAKKYADEAARLRAQLILSQSEVKPCPFCGGTVDIDSVLRDGYEKYQDDPDARAYFCRCISCAAQGGWAKTETSAIRYWNMRKP